MESPLKTSGIETFRPVMGAIIDGSTILLSLTELERESSISCTDLRLDNKIHRSEGGREGGRVEGILTS